MEEECMKIAWYEHVRHIYIIYNGCIYVGIFVMIRIDPMQS